jgi:hypothetical protein
VDRRARLRGGVLIPLASPAEHWIQPLNHPDYDRLWAVIQDCDLVMNQHSGQGSPPYPEAQGSTPLWALEMMFFVQRGFTHLISAVCSSASRSSATS